MFRALFRIMIVLSIFAAASSAFAEEGENGTASLVDIAPSMGGEEATVAAEDNSTETVATEIEEPTMTVVQNGENETAPAEVSPEAEAEVTAVGAPVAFNTSMTVLPAVADVYVNLTEEMVYNEAQLVSQYLMGDQPGGEDFPGVVMVQFDLSGLSVGDDDVAVLVLKAESVEKVGDEMAGIFIAPVTSEWSESSSVTALALNMLALIFMISSGEDIDFRQVGMNFGGDRIYAFDVSEHVKGAEGGKISFLLMAVGDTDYKVVFKSRETGEGPSLLIGPYPAAPAAAA